MAGLGGKAAGLADWSKRKSPYGMKPGVKRSLARCWNETLFFHNNDKRFIIYWYIEYSGIHLIQYLIQNVLE